MFQNLKGSSFENTFSLEVNYVQQESPLGFRFYCKAAGPWILESSNWLERMMTARDMSQDMYFSRFPPQLESLSNYLEEGAVKNTKKILFLIVDDLMRLHGHIGLKVNIDNKIEIDNVLRISEDFPGLIHASLLDILNWAKMSLGLNEFCLQVISTNHKAIRLYLGLGFKIKETRSLRVEILENRAVNLVEVEMGQGNTSEEKYIMEKYL